MNLPEVVAILEIFLEALQKRQSSQGLTDWGDVNVTVQRLTPSVLRIAERVDPSQVEPIRIGVVHHGIGTTFMKACDAVHQVIGALQQQEMLDALLGPAGPQLAARGLHPWVWEPASRLWDDGHRREAIQAAATQIDLQLQGRLDGSSASPGSDLVTQAFKTDDPKPGSPRLRFRGLAPGTDTWRSAHEGAMSFGRGCFMAIRNLATHTLDQPEEQVALEMLAALSVLARWIDEAEVMESQGRPGAVKRLNNPRAADGGTPMPG